MRTPHLTVTGAILLILASLISGGAGYLLGAIRATNQLYARQAGEKIARIRPILNDPKFAEVSALHGSGPEITLDGSVQDKATLKELKERLRVVVGEGEARELGANISVEKRVAGETE